LSLRHLGETQELRRWHDEYLRDAVRRGDRYTETSLRRALNLLWLIQDQPAEAHRNLELPLWMPPEGTFHVQHWYEIMARVELDLYEDNASSTLERMQASFQALERSLLPRVVTVRTLLWWFRGRMALARSLGGQHPWRARNEASRMAKKLEHEGSAYRPWA